MSYVLAPPFQSSPILTNLDPVAVSKRRDGKTVRNEGVPKEQTSEPRRPSHCTAQLLASHDAYLIAVAGAQRPADRISPLIGPATQSKPREGS